MGVKDNFKQKIRLEESLFERFPLKKITHRKHKEMGDLPGEVQNLVLYYADDVHVGTWNSTKRKGWSFN